MKTLISILVAVSLVGCAGIMDKMPSKWDPNQAKAVTDLRQSANNFDCKGNLTEQLMIINYQLQWFELYSESKGTKDVQHMGDAIRTTTKEMQERVVKGPVSPIYCDLKKKLLVQQTDIMARAVQGRF